MCVVFIIPGIDGKHFFSFVFYGSIIFKFYVSCGSKCNVLLLELKIDFLGKINFCVISASYNSLSFVKIYPDSSSITHPNLMIVTTVKRSC